SAPIISTSLYFLFDMPPLSAPMRFPKNEENHICFCAVLGVKVKADYPLRPSRVIISVMRSSDWIAIRAHRVYHLESRFLDTVAATRRVIKSAVKGTAMATLRAQRKKRKSGIPSGNAGEYFVMGELLRRGFDAQLADRNTQGYDLLVGRSGDKTLRKVQVKTVRAQPWYINLASFNPKHGDQATVYVLLGDLGAKKPVRYFVAKNRVLAKHVYRPKKWKQHGFMPMAAVESHENKWETLLQ
ncbi:MAG: hypothetical protein WBD87_00810, partial [Candidatus Acidiferrales bacterium]